MSDANFKTFDFLPGKSCWGHALHTSTFRAAEPRKVERGGFQKPDFVQRVQVMAHCYGPRLGDRVTYKGQSGTIRTCVIVELERALSVDDLYTLTLEEEPAQ